MRRSNPEGYLRALTFNWTLAAAWLGAFVFFGFLSNWSWIVRTLACVLLAVSPPNRRELFLSRERFTEEKEKGQRIAQGRGNSDDGTA